MLTWWLTGCKDLNALPTEMPMWDASNTSFSYAWYDMYR